MRVHSLTILHYGKDYLGYALRSIYDSVDQLHIFYTPTPSHGHQTSISTIETKEELMQAAYVYDPDNKIKWYDMLGVINEGTQRDLALKTVKAAGAELVLVVDYDEIWDKTILESCLIYTSEHDYRRYMINMIHFWRSFNWACYDNGWPVRIIKPNSRLDWTEYIPAELGKVFHFGYATTDRVMNYKWQIHGHKNELRPEWLKDIWPVWPPVYPNEDGIIRYPGDKSFCCHPTNRENFWEPEPFDKLQLPDFMHLHPFFGLEKIE